MSFSSPFEGYSDDVLAKACAQRPTNEEAWREFWRRFYPFIRRKVTRILSHFGKEAQAGTVDDVVQLVFLKILRTLPRYEPDKSPLTAFLSLIVSSTVLDQIRPRRSRQRLLSFEEAEVLSSSLRSGGIGAEELWLLTMELLKRVEPRKREVLRDLLAGDSREEICRRHGISRSLLYTITYRFRRDLRRALEKSCSGVSD
jgi:RNA polymerase sigma factor (sigma-70 family)